MRIEELLNEARAALVRLSPADARAAMDRGEAVVVDIREKECRERDGRVRGAIEIERNVLEWRCAPRSEWRDERVCDPDRVVVLMCNEGYQSSLAAAVPRSTGATRLVRWICCFPHADSTA